MDTRPVTVWLAHWPELHDSRPFVIAAREGSGPVVEFRGPPYEHDAWQGSPAQRFHDALEGYHSCILHAEGGPFCVHSEHGDFEAVKALMREE